MAAALARLGATRATAATTVAAAAASTAAGFASVRTKVTLPQLPYSPAALEPVISAQIMELHHSKHHAAYVNNYNAAEEKLNEALAKGDLAGAIALQPALRFNGGGHLNHSIFWTNLAPPKEGGGEGPTDALFDAIKAQWGSFDAFKTEFNNAAAAVQGSGWGWLGYNKQYKRLVIATTPNQDPLVTLGHVPLLGVDVWEHAYYLQYKNARPEYLKEIWKVVNWQNVGQRFEQARA